MFEEHKQNSCPIRVTPVIPFTHSTLMLLVSAAFVSAEAYLSVEHNTEGAKTLAKSHTITTKVDQLWLIEWFLNNSKGLRPPGVPLKYPTASRTAGRQW